MGMTIDEAVKVIHKMLAYTDLSVRANLKADMIDACHMAIDTMRKYQKIKEQVDIAIDKENFAISDARLIQIREIINGNVD